MKKKILGIALLVLVIALLAIVYVKFSEKPVEGSKSITIEVVNSEGESVKYELKTDALYLAEAMDEAKEEGLEYETEEGPYGLTVLSVNGETAIFEENGAYWGFYVNDEYCNFGISEQPVNDGDNFKIEYTK